MTIDTWLQVTSTHLQLTGNVAARLDCLVLLEDCLQKDRAWLLAHSEQELTTAQLKTLNEQIARRARHEPLAYIRGKVEFYGREFGVNKHVLVPRPETETMITLFLKIAAEVSSPLTIIDIGTGSGALAITTQLEVPRAKVIAIDIDENCLEVARINARYHSATPTFYEGDLLAPLLTTKLTAELILLCNLPYVPANYTVNQAAQHEPQLALYGGQDGLDLYRRLFQQIDQLANKPHYLLTESLYFQRDALQEIAAVSGYHCLEQTDLIQVFERN